MISEKILSFLSKVPEKFSGHASGIMLNIVFIVITILSMWVINDIIDEYGSRNGYDSPAIPLFFITTFSIGVIFIAVLIVDIIATLAK